MNQVKVFQIKSSNVVSETIDGEVVIVNLEKGDYYSLFNSAADIWNKVEQGTDLETIVTKLENCYDCSSVNLVDVVNNFLGKLETEGLIAANLIEETQYRASQTAESSPTSEKKPIENPRIEKFTDMEDLLLLDPIHEADEEKGWPTAQDSVA